MAKIHIHAGDFEQGKGVISFSHGKMPRLAPALAFGKFSWTGYGKSVCIDPVEIEATDQSTALRLGRSLGGATLGAIVGEGVGALVGALVGGIGQDITFSAKLKDGRVMLATTDLKTYEKLTALLP